MPRYIDAEKLIKHIMENSAHWQKNEWYTVGALAAIARTPTADVREVKRGKWIVCGMFDDFLKCSICGFEITMFNAFNYCPICGAKMDEKEEIDDTDSKTAF